MFRAAKAKEEIDVGVGSNNPRTSSTSIRKSPRLVTNKAAKEEVQTKTNGMKRKVIESSYEPPQKRRVYKCNYDGCTNKAMEDKLCRIHGAKSYNNKCSHEDCTNFSRTGRGGVCVKHGAEVKFKICIHEGCTITNQREGRSMYQAWRQANEEALLPT